MYRFTAFGEREPYYKAGISVGTEGLPLLRFRRYTRYYSAPLLSVFLKSYFVFRLHCFGDRLGTLSLMKAVAVLE